MVLIFLQVKYDVLVLTPYTQKTAIKVREGVTNWFDSGWGVSQGCSLSATLFNM